MVFNATFNNISVISWRSVLLVVETGLPGENHWPVASHWQTLSQKRDHYIWCWKSRSWLGKGTKNIIILLSIITKSLCFWLVDTTLCDKILYVTFGRLLVFFSWHIGFFFHKQNNRIGDVMVSTLASSAVDLGIEPQSDKNHRLSNWYLLLLR